ncbi:MAG TPA: hypothetical protein PLF31_03510 [Candidatus Paceibacterota bacterium]|nr:hypothetical protein [Candidatus Paceibacterota bacterium]
MKLLFWILVILAAGTAFTMVASHEGWIDLSGDHGQATTTVDHTDDKYVDEPVATSTPTITSPRQGQEIMAGFVVRGMSPGYWFFENTAGLELVSASGTVLYQTYASVDEGYSWMTEDVVPWTGKLSFDLSEIKTKLGLPASLETIDAFLVFKNDNPSGLPENDKSIRIPVEIMLEVASPAAQ